MWGAFSPEKFRERQDWESLVSSKFSYIKDCGQNKIQCTRKIPHGITTKEFLKPTTSMCNQEDKENTGYKILTIQMSRQVR
jgi:hypothetical protein